MVVDESWISTRQWSIGVTSPYMPHALNTQAEAQIDFP